MTTASGAADPLFLDAIGQLALLAKGEIGARDLLSLAVARADRLNPAINAVVARDLDRGFRDAEAIDAARARGEPLGPLAGLPMTVKDTLDVEGLPALAGLAGLLGREAADADVVGRLRAAGAVVWGKTNTPPKAADWQTFNPVYGVTRNPWDLARTPGGSSGGSAAALAAGFAPLEIGADIAGSLRIPAGFCGVFAHKPTFGLVSQRGLVPPVEFAGDIDMAVVGPMARSARDLALLLPIIAQAPLEPAAPAGLAGLRVALWLDEPALALDPQVREVVENFAEGLSAAGAAVEGVSAPVDVHTLLSAYAILLFSLSGADLPPVTRAGFELLRGPARIALAMGAGPLSWAQGVMGYTARRGEWRQADEVRRALTARMAAFFERFDVILAPVAPVPAFPHDHRPVQVRRIPLSGGGAMPYLRLMERPALATVCGLPATAVPAGFTAEGLPVGVQLIGAAGSDMRLLAIAQAAEAQLGGFRPPNFED